MKKFISLTIMCFFLIVIAGACLKSKSHLALNNKDTKIKITLVEQLNANGRLFKLNCETDQSYACCNYTINNTIAATSNSFNINFLSINKPDICLTAPGPAIATIELHQLPEGAYSLNINVFGKHVDGQLLVTANKYSITMSKINQLEIVNPDLLRIPDNSIWGTVGYNSTATLPLVQTFFDSLKQAGATEQAFSSGDYGYFKIDANGKILPPGNDGYWYAKYYIYKYAGNFTSMKKIIENFDSTYPDSLHMSIRTSKGEVFVK